MTYEPETYWPDRYARQGPTYVARGGRQAAWEAEKAWVEPYFEHLPTAGAVLDFGCGPGRFRAALEGRGLSYHGHDLIPGLGDVEEIEPDTYDAVVAVMVLQHIVDDSTYSDVLRTLYCALRDGGNLLVIDHNPIARPDEHMRPRGPGPITMKPWRGRYVEPADDRHWCGVFAR